MYVRGNNFHNNNNNYEVRNVKIMLKRQQKGYIDLSNGYFKCFFPHRSFSLG